MPGRMSGFRGRLFSAVHAEAQKRGMDHDALRAMCHAQYGVHSMSEMTEANLLKIYYGWTGKSLRRKAKLPRRGEAAKQPQGEIQIASAEELITLDAEFAKRGLGQEGRENFIRRQLGGRGIVRTRRDFCSVLGGLRAMNKRDGGVALTEQANNNTTEREGDTELCR